VLADPLQIENGTGTTSKIIRKNKAITITRFMSTTTTTKTYTRFDTEVMKIKIRKQRKT
jgi:phosphoribulokinase